jgi:hypothetical protein
MIATKTQHTPGPWHFDGQEFNDVREADGELVAVALHLRTRKPERSLAEAEANARLMAAAPDLLEACKAALSDYEPYIEKCRAAIAKATGVKGDTA